MGAEVRRRVHLARAAARRHDAWWRSCGGVRARGGGVRTGVAVRLAGEARKGFRLAAVLAPWLRGWRWSRGRSCKVAWLNTLERGTQPNYWYEREREGK